MRKPSRLALALLLSTLGAAGCAFEHGSVDPEGVVAQDQPLYIQNPNGNLWSSTTIPVCWENKTVSGITASELATRKAWIKTAVEGSWQHVSALRFTGWGTCSSGASGIHIDPTVPSGSKSAHVGAIGNALDGVDSGMHINVTAICDRNDAFTSIDGRVWDNGCQYALSVRAIHEFGHALGFLHESDRGDNPTTCVDGEPNYDRSNAVTVGEWDIRSVMSQSYCVNSYGKLSAADIAGVQRFYGVGAQKDWLWVSEGVNTPAATSAFTVPPRQTFQVKRVTQPGAGFTPIAGDFDGDGYTDIFWYKPGTGADRYWWGGDGTFTSAAATVDGSTYAPIAGDFDHDGTADILWYSPGAASHSIWWHQKGVRNAHGGSWIAQPGSSWRPMVGDFDGDHFADVLWYRFDDSNQQLWYGDASRSFSARKPFTVSGNYTAFTGDFDGDGATDVFWYLPDLGGAPASRIWWSAKSRSYVGANGAPFTSQTLSVYNQYRPVVGDFDGNGASDIVWESHPATTGESIWMFKKATSAAGRGHDAYPTSIWGDFKKAVTGRFTADSMDDIYWYGE